ncbi:hypothetical protein MK805_14305 [Shimazuella sp. AN120528]|uniref:hypothetical protein n=1 Tax=Shimazuella soli TaxID=1892854 RepID=UPI001F0E1136|nr:hypothetical protein [Shimazuella soli]MCH5586110.1 hypothetical protein [Shimazuella soli]
MQQNHFQRSVTIQAPFSEVYNYLSEYQNLIHLNPFMVDIREFPSNTPHKSTLKIKDKLSLFGFVPFYKNFKTIAEAHPLDCSITMKTTTFPNIQIQNDLKLQANNDETVVMGNTLVESPDFLVEFVMKRVTYSHAHMLIELKKIMEKSIT